MDDPIHVSPRRLLAADGHLRQKQAIAALVDHYTHGQRSGPNDSSSDAVQVSPEELDLLKRVLGVAHPGARHITRNSYFAARFGVKRRAFELLRDRGLVTLVEENGSVVCQATTRGVNVVVHALRQNAHEPQPTTRGHMALDCRS